MRLAQADAKVDLSRFADVLGANFTPEKMPDSGRVLSQSRARYRHGGRHRQGLLERPRPFLADAQIHPPGQMQQETAIARARARKTPRPMMPSRLAALPSRRRRFPIPTQRPFDYGAVTAILLANMLPEKRRELFARGWDYGESAWSAASIFPRTSNQAESSDGDGRLMMQNADFKADLAAARAELRRSLGLLNDVMPSSLRL